MQELPLCVMVGVKNTAFGVTDGYMHPWSTFPTIALSFAALGFMPGDDAVCLEGRIRLCGIGDSDAPGVHGLLYFAFLRGRLQIRDNLHFDVADPFPRTALPCRRIYGCGTLRHDKDSRLPLASESTFERIEPLLAGRFRGEEPLVELHVVGQAVEPVAPAHHVTQLVHHLPNRLVAFPSKLTLYLQG